MSDPSRVSRNALRGRKIAISVSKSSDLRRLGLTDTHLRLAVAEIARAILVSGGSVTYAGDLRQGGFTRLLVDEVQRFADNRLALELFLPWQAHNHLADDALRQWDEGLGLSGRMYLFGPSGSQVALKDRAGEEEPNEDSGLSAARAFMTERSNARIVVGGRLSGWTGAMPGVLHEAELSIERNQPLYVAGGFGGAAAALAKAFDPTALEWMPDDMPHHGVDEDVAGHVQRIADLTLKSQVQDGLDVAQRRQLASSHRPGDIATLTAIGLATALAGTSF